MADKQRSIDERRVAYTVRRLADVEKIKQLKVRYFRLLDQHEWEEFAQLFTPDLKVDIGRINQPAVRRAQRDQLRKRPSSYMPAQHLGRERSTRSFL